jgi:hypothetical protein
MASRARAATNALLDIGRDPSEARILDFVSSYGPLVDFQHWARRAWPQTVLDRILEDALAYGETLRDAVSRHRIDLVRPHSDHASFFDWCVSHQSTGNWNYTARVITYEMFPEPLREPLIPEPLSFYIWAGETAIRAQEELGRNSLSSETLHWLANRLDDTRLALTERVGTVTTEGENLLAYIAMQLVLKVRGEGPTRRKCLCCGIEFQVDDDRRVYCSPKCQEKSRKRRQRRNQAK